jgi:hypothetical protein
MNCAISVVGDGSMIARLAGNLRPGRKLGSTRGIVILSVAKDLRLLLSPPRQQEYGCPRSRFWDLGYHEANLARSS